jgi:hypothetical protein
VYAGVGCGDVAPYGTGRLIPPPVVHANVCESWQRPGADLEVQAMNSGVIIRVTQYTQRASQPSFQNRRMWDNNLSARFPLR